MADDGVVRISTQVDVSNLRSGMEQAASAVQSSTRTMSSAMEEARAASQRLAEAQTQFGAAAAAGSEQAASVLQMYRTELASAQSAVQALAGSESEETAVLQSNISARMAASAELRVLEGNMMGSTRAAGAFLSMLPGLGAAMQVAFPIFGAVALVEILGRAVKAVGELVTAYKDLDGAAIKASTDAIIAGEKIVKISPSFDANAASRLFVGAGLQSDIAVQNASPKLKEIEYARELADAQAAINEQGKIGIALQQQKIADAQKDLQSAKEAKVAAEDLVESYRKQLEAKTKVTNPAAFYSSGVAAAGIQADRTQEINTITDPKQVAAVQGQLKTAAEAVEEFQHRIDLAQVHLQGVKLKLPEIDDKAFKASMEAHLAAQQRATESIDEASKAEAEALSRVARAATDAGNTPFFQSALHAIPQMAGEARQQLVQLAEAIAKLKTPSLDEDSGKQLTQQYDTATEAIGKFREAQDEARLIALKNADALQEATIRAQESLGVITPLAAAEKLAALHTREHAEALKELNDQLQFQQKTGKDADAQQTQDQITQLQGNRNNQNLQDWAKIQQQIAQPMMNAFQMIDQSWLQVQNSIFYSTRNLGQEFAKMGQQIFISIVDNMEKAALFALQKELAMSLAHRVAVEEGITTDAAGAAQSQAIAQGSALKQQFMAAKVAASNTYQVVSGWPVVGPILAPIMAAGAFTAVAAFDTGTGYVPSDGLAFIHQGEAVIPAPTVEDLRGSDGGGGDININHTTNINAATDRAIVAAIRRNPHEIANAIQRHMRQRGRTPR